MARDGKDWLEDILQAIGDIETFTEGMDEADFAKSVETDRKTILAIAASFMQIGEASRVLPAELKARQTSIEWHKIVALRNVLVHEYFRRDSEVIWEIIAGGKLRALKAVVEDELHRLSPPT